MQHTHSTHRRRSSQPSPRRSHSRPRSRRHDSSAPSKPSRARHPFRSVFACCFHPNRLNALFRRFRLPRRRTPRLSFAELVLALVYHVLMGSGSLQAHVAELTGKQLSGSALSQRRSRLPWKLFEQVLALTLRPRATPKEHPHAFYHGLRLVGLDGTGFALRNTPAVCAGLRKAASRRLKAAFARVRVVVLVELGLHNPIAARIGGAGESEYKLAEQLVSQLPARSVVLGDRLYGVPAFVARLLGCIVEAGSEFLVRVRRNLKVRVLERLADGSTWVEVQTRDLAGRKVRWQMREIHARVRGRGGKVTRVRLWTSLRDARRHPASTLLALYAQRWEVELMVHELKVEVRSGDLLGSYTPETAAQEIAALLLALGALVEVRCRAGAEAEVSVLRVSFRQTVRLVRALWTLLALGEGIHTAAQVRALVRRTWERIVWEVTPARRARSCPRAVRQPVSSWPRLLRRRNWKGPITYEIIPYEGRTS